MNKRQAKKLEKRKVDMYLEDGSLLKTFIVKWNVIKKWPRKKGKKND